MDNFTAPETHDHTICDCKDCRQIRWEYWYERGQ
jgi:hypothetical protein